ncbi:MAG: prenyltransferase/squalene oxidase repeat-containing protein [Candidatus Hermodarchaeota archaeon]
MDIEKAIKFVRSKGNEIEKARLDAILWDKPIQEDILKQLAAFQKSDGGFCYWIKEVSNICDTIYVLFWFDDLKLYSGPIVEPACRFLLNRQQKDGGWDEVDKVQKFNPPEWLIPGRIETRVWLTAYCAHVLIRFGYAEAEGTYCPTDFLMANCDESGRLTGYLRATWIALPMLAFYPGPEPKSFQKAISVVESNYSPDWEGSYLAWLLRCLNDAGLSRSHALVERCLVDLKRKQRIDGSWQPENEEGEDHSVNATIEAVHAFKKYNLI